MCGILFSVWHSTDTLDASINIVEPYIKARGPDSYFTLTKFINIDGLEFNVTFASSVLHLRGEGITRQPLVSPEGNVLCWNGEIWCNFAGWKPYHGNDGLVLLSHLSNIRNIQIAFNNIQGPYAFVYYQNEEGKVWFGRDRLGRKSLLRKASTTFVLSSVGEGTEKWDDIQANVYNPDIVGHHPLCLLWFGLHRLVTYSKTKSHFILNKEIPSNCIKLDPLSAFHSVLLEAIRIRALTVPNCCKNRPRVAVLYSGGLDCGTITRLLHDVLPVDEPVDLVNVAFENPRFLSSHNLNVENGYQQCPDRLTGLQGWKELVETTSSRDWRFIEVNVPYSETLKFKKEILQLAHPNNSVMDLDIAKAFYFSARAQGKLVLRDGSKLDYTSNAKVLFSGMGADEQLGGYSRHLDAFRTGGWGKLIQELQIDIDRLPTRNLGRDDRLISHHGKEIRYPFLDENVVSYLCSLQINQKMDLSRKGGDKLLLRRLATSLGIVKTAKEKKRAIQFGSKAAKMGIGEGRISGQQRVE